MKDFDIEKAKAGAPVCTRGGMSARIICWDSGIICNDRNYPIVAIIGTIDEDFPKTVDSYDEQGRCQLSGKSPDDLMMASTKREGWVYLSYKDGLLRSSRCVYETAEFAKKTARNIVNDKEWWIARIEWEE